MFAQRSFSGIFDLYVEDERDGSLIHGLDRERRISLASPLKPASLPSTTCDPRRWTRPEDVYRLNISYEVEVSTLCCTSTLSLICNHKQSYPNLQEIDPEWEHDDIEVQAPCPPHNAMLT
jgi:hypothetical protein